MHIDTRRDNLRTGGRVVHTKDTKSQEATYLVVCRPKTRTRTVVRQEVEILVYAFSQGL